MGKFEVEEFAAGTQHVARAIAACTAEGAITVVGGTSPTWWPCVGSPRCSCSTARVPVRCAVKLHHLLASRHVLMSSYDVWLVVLGTGNSL
jgi:hypothetical protein